jgi:hypothetical protein
MGWSYSFALDAPVARKTKKNWRAAADEDGHYCFAVAL